MSGSYYAGTAPHRTPAPALVGTREARVCVIGAGFAGLNTALGLAERGMRDVVVLEAQRIAHGASGRNGGFVFGGFSRGEEALLRELGPERARAMYRGTLDAVELIRTRVHRHGIACDIEESGVIWANWFADEEVLRERQQLLSRSYGVDWEWLTREALRERVRSDRYREGLFEPSAFHFHPLRYAQGLAGVAQVAGVALYEDTPAVALERDGSGWRVQTPQGVVHAQEVVLACGGYLAGLRRKVDASVLPIATYVLATEPLGAALSNLLTTGAAVYDTRFAFDYYRPLHDTRLLWGGRISVRDRSASEVERLLRADIGKVFPTLRDARVDFAWSGLMSYARHQMPQIGNIEPGLWLAQAFGGHGVAPTTFAGELIASAIAEGDTRWQTLSRYGLVSAFKPAGFAAAQLSYWWAEARDAWKDWNEGRANA